MRRRQGPAVPVPLVEQIDEALTVLRTVQTELTHATADQAPLVERRAAHAKLRNAFDDADALLRQATAMAKQHSYREWSLWRHRLSKLDTARQIHLFAEQDEPGLLSAGSVRVIDTGMPGPNIKVFGASCCGLRTGPGSVEQARCPEPARVR